MLLVRLPGVKSSDRALIGRFGEDHQVGFEIVLGIGRRGVVARELAARAVRAVAAADAARQIGEQRTVALKRRSLDRAGDVQGSRRIGGVDADPAGRGLDRQR